MNRRLKKNGIIFVAAIALSIILTFVTNSFEWSSKVLSDMLTYSGVAVMTYGAYIASNMSNMSNMFSNLKKNMNERYSPEEKAKKDKIAKANLIEGWMLLATGSIIIILSIIAIRI